MSVVNTDRALARNFLAVLAMLAVLLPVVWLATSFGKFALFGVIGVVGLVVAVYVGVRHPLWYFWGLAAVTAALPFGRVPGIGIPIWYLFVFGAIVAAFFHPRFARSTHPLEFAAWAMILTAALSLVVTGQTLIDYSFFIRWSLGALFLFALARLAPEHAVRFGKIYAVLAAINGLYGIFILAFDPGYKTLEVLSAFGYEPKALVSRVAFAGENAETSLRLGGTWVDPNNAGLHLALGLALVFLLFAGWRRIVLAALLSVALVLTLSRAATFTVVVGVLVVLIFHPMGRRARVSLLSLMAAAALGALAAEPVRRRIFSSFGEGDAGAAARADALRAFPGQMSGHWGFGWGWGRREFLDPAYAFALNLPSNAPLIVLYRSGIFAFIAFAALTVIAGVYAYRAVRSTSFAPAMYGGIFIGLCLVQMQLDHPLAATPSGALTYSIFLAFLVYIDRERRAALRRETPMAETTQPATAPPFVETKLSSSGSNRFA